jgi:hypothetical protein
MKIKITCGEIAAEAELNDSPCAQAVAEALPITGSVNRWGEEVYFSIPVSCDLGDDARDVLAVGELAYWPPGSAFCIFFGRTPASKGDEPRAASDVNPIGNIPAEAAVFANVRDGQEIMLAPAE